jgi:pilus assembly protein CpaB
MAAYASSVHGAAEESRQQSLSDYGGAQIEVYVANRNIAVGERLTTSNVSRRVWLADLLPAGSLSAEEDVIGQTLGLPLLANEPVTAAKLSTASAPIVVADGYCAVSIPTNDVSAVGGAVSAGSVIDIYAADKDGVQLIASEVLVLETSNGSQQAAEPNGLLGSNRSRATLSWVTLSIPADMVEDIISASRTMNLYLVLPGGEF